MTDHNLAVCAVVVCEWILGIGVLIKNHGVRNGFLQFSSDPCDDVRMSDSVLAVIQGRSIATDMTLRSIPSVRTTIQQSGNQLEGNMTLTQLPS